MTITTEQASPPADNSTPGPTLGRLIRGELLKVRTTNLWRILGVCVLVATALALLVNGATTHFQIAEALDPPPDFAARQPAGQQPSPEELARMQAQWRLNHDLGTILLRGAANMFTSGQYFGLLIVMLLGALLVTGEYYNQTATTTFLAAPRRTPVIAAKAATAIIVAAIAWFVTTAIDLGVGTVFFAVEGRPNSLDVWSVQRAVLMNLPAYALWALLGMGLGALVRNQIVATLAGAGLYLIGNQVVQFFFVLVYEFLITKAWVLQSMVLVPGIASTVMITPGRVEVWSTEDGTTFYAPQWWVGALVLVGYGLIATAVGALLIRRRDIS